jgi:HD-GYP domain-containing protein (c-di-GMP phosphodiesterase class II)
VVRIGELLGALSLATDLGSGNPLETSLRTCVLATRLGRRLALPDINAVRRTALLRHLGCTAFAHEAARIAGDDHELLTTFAGVDITRRAALAGRTMTRLGRGTGFSKRVATIAKAVTRPKAGAALIAAQCAQAVALAEDLEMPANVVSALGQIYERHDGRGAPHGVAGDAMEPAAQLLHLAELVEIHHRTAGRDAAIAEVKKRRGRHLAPEVADAFLAEHEHLWALLESASVWDHYLDADDRDEPDLAIDRVARAFGRYADFKSPHTLAHSAGVAELAVAATEGDASRIRIAALLHDLGTVSVPNGIWDKPGPLNAAEWERVRLHAYYTQRILAQTPILADVAVIAGAHHERLDGSGYHRNVDASHLDRAARVLAAADAFQAMQQRRAYREPMSREDAAAALVADARAGKLCPRAVEAVLGAVGQAVPARTLPAGLTPREVEVLVMLARGRTNKEIARELGIAVRTTNHHVEHIYAKIDVTTRAAAALFAVRHDLVQL